MKMFDKMAVQHRVALAKFPLGADAALHIYFENVLSVGFVVVFYHIVQQSTMDVRTFFRVYRTRYLRI